MMGSMNNNTSTMDGKMTGQLVTRSRTLYTFAELTGEVRNRVIEAERQDEHRSMPEDVIRQDLEEHILVHLAGLTIDKAQLTTMRKEFMGELDVEWSLSHCQGDGVALYGRIYRTEAPHLTWADNVEYVRLVRNHYGQHYTHYNTFTIEFYNEDDDLLGSQVSDHLSLAVYLNEDGSFSYMGTSDTDNMSKEQYDAYNKMSNMSSFLRNLCRDLARVGYDAIDDFTSEERIVELLTEYDARKYDKNGNVVEFLWWAEDNWSC